MKRLAALAIVLLAFGAARPAAAQTSPLQPVVDQLTPVVGQLQPVLDQLAPVTGQLDPAVAQLLGQLNPLVDQLAGILAQAQPACAVLGPVLGALDPVTTQLDGLLAVDTSGLGPVAAVQPLLDTVDGLVGQALGLCAAQVTTTTTSTTAAPPADGGGGAAPAAELPRTGGPDAIALAGLGGLGLAGALLVARRRLV